MKAELAAKRAAKKNARQAEKLSTGKDKQIVEGGKVNTDQVTTNSTKITFEGYAPNQANDLLAFNTGADEEPR